MSDADFPALLNLLLGVWIFISAFLWPHTPLERNQDVAIGILAVLVAMFSISRPAVRWAGAALAVWLFLSTFAIDHEVQATRWNDAIVALALFIAALIPARIDFRTTSSRFLSFILLLVFTGLVSEMGACHKGAPNFDRDPTTGRPRYVPSAVSSGLPEVPDTILIIPQFTDATGEVVRTHVEKVDQASRTVVFRALENDDALKLKAGGELFANFGELKALTGLDEADALAQLIPLPDVLLRVEKTKSGLQVRAININRAGK
jgi:hypothetical protein